MSSANGNRNSNKRKHVEETHLSEFQTNGGLEMLSDEEDSWDLSSDDEVDEFPEIATEDESEDEESEAESLHLFPNPKIVISDVTNQPKRVYPEIEADYDSDSSTEDVSVLLEA
jgi:ribosome biogenesis protein ERB1